MADSTITLDQSEVLDGSSLVAGFDPSALVAGGAKIAKGLVRNISDGTALTQAWSLVLGIVALATRDEADYPCWTMGATMPDAGRTLLAAILTAAGLSEEDGKAISQTVRTYWSRTAREAFMACYVLENTPDAKHKSTVENKTQAEKNYAAALKLLGPDLVALLPETLQSEPFVPSGINAAMKRGMADQFRHAGITLPVKYGGEEPGGNESGTKYKAAKSPAIALEGVAVAVSEKVGVEGGPSHSSILSGILRVLSAETVAAFAASEIVDRPVCEEYAARILLVSQSLGKVLHNVATPEDMETVSPHLWDAEKDK